eukprot:TRINITY_DN4607_c0_g1_i1.p1 TRINITY_DN4607_c0_g1~~TRINITY_DN4607_c0_g1_i1.p1  ORF type:complete len:1278 (+),score=585.62 TRINITY_DN4607_c0_g1_i1:63-3836(+)
MRELCAGLSTYFTEDGKLYVLSGKSVEDEEYVWRLKSDKATGSTFFVSAADRSRKVWALPDVVSELAGGRSASADGCPELVVVLCATKPEAQGAYRLSGDSVHGLPVWAQSREQRLYADQYGRWIVGAADVMDAGAGWVLSDGTRDEAAMWPQHQTGWSVFQEGEWTHDPSVQLATAAAAGEPVRVRVGFTDWVSSDGVLWCTESGGAEHTWKMKTDSTGRQFFVCQATRDKRWSLPDLGGPAPAAGQAALEQEIVDRRAALAAAEGRSQDLYQTELRLTEECSELLAQRERALERAEAEAEEAAREGGVPPTCVEHFDTDIELQQRLDSLERALESEHRRLREGAATAAAAMQTQAVSDRDAGLGALKRMRERLDAEEGELRKRAAELEQQAALDTPLVDEAAAARRAAVISHHNRDMQLRTTELRRAASVAGDAIGSEMHGAAARLDAGANRASLELQRRARMLDEGSAQLREQRDWAAQARDEELAEEIRAKEEALREREERVALREAALLSNPVVDEELEIDRSRLQQHVNSYYGAAARALAAAQSSLEEQALVAARQAARQREQLLDGFAARERELQRQLQEAKERRASAGAARAEQADLRRQRDEALAAADSDNSRTQLDYRIAIEELHAAADAGRRRSTSIYKPQREGERERKRVSLSLPPADAEEAPAETEAPSELQQVLSEAEAELLPDAAPDPAAAERQQLRERRRELARRLDEGRAELAAAARADPAVGAARGRVDRERRKRARLAEQLAAFTEEKERLLRQLESERAAVEDENRRRDAAQADRLREAQRSLEDDLRRQLTALRAAFDTQLQQHSGTAAAARTAAAESGSVAEADEERCRELEREMEELAAANAAEKRRLVGEMRQDADARAEQRRRRERDADDAAARDLAAKLSDLRRQEEALAAALEGMKADARAVSESAQRRAAAASSLEALRTAEARQRRAQADRMRDSQRELIRLREDQARAHLDRGGGEELDQPLRERIEEEGDRVKVEHEREITDLVRQVAAERERIVADHRRDRDAAADALREAKAGAAREEAELRTQLREQQDARRLEVRRVSERYAQEREDVRCELGHAKRTAERLLDELAIERQTEDDLRFQVTAERSRSAQSGATLNGEIKHTRSELRKREAEAASVKGDIEQRCRHLLQQEMAGMESEVVVRAPSRSPQHRSASALALAPQTRAADRSASAQALIHRSASRSAEPPPQYAGRSQAGHRSASADADLRRLARLREGVRRRLERT